MTQKICIEIGVCFLNNSSPVSQLFAFGVGSRSDIDVDRVQCLLPRDLISISGQCLTIQGKNPKMRTAVKTSKCEHSSIRTS